MTAVIIQSNKIVSNKVHDNSVLPEPSYGIKQMNFWPTQYTHVRKKSGSGE